MALAELWQIGIEKTEGVWWFDYPDSGGALLFDDLIAERFHPGPMDLGPEMVLGMVAVEKPDPVVKPVVAAYAPGDRLIGVSAVMAVVTIQVGEAMAEIPEADQENDVMPVQDAEGDEGADEKEKGEPRVRARPSLRPT